MLLSPISYHYLLFSFCSLDKLGELVYMYTYEVNMSIL